MSYLSGVRSPQQFAGVQEGLAPANAGRLARTNSESSLGAQSGVTTSMSSSATMLAGVSSASDVRMDRVTALQTSIDAGTYYVPAADVAGRLMGALLN